MCPRFLAAADLLGVHYGQLEIQEVALIYTIIKDPIIYLSSIYVHILMKNILLGISPLYHYLVH